MKRIACALLASLLLCVCLTACGAPETPPDSPNSAVSADEPDESASSHVDFRLISGHHTAGVDFPAGTYQLNAIQWSGHVKSSNGAVDSPMGFEQHNTNGVNIYESVIDDVDLPAGTVLSLSGGVILRMISDDADTAPLTPRDQEITESVTLTAGRFVAGTDFPAGTYDFTAITGIGNVESSNMNDYGINDVMGTTWRISEGFGFCVADYENIELPEGTTLSISGVELLLTPSE